MLRNPAETAAAVEQMQEENDSFLDHLRQYPAAQLDGLVHRLNETVSSEIDCTQCGQCCRSLMINVKPDEIPPLAGTLGLDLADFTSQYLEQSQQGAFIVNRQPCYFLSDNKCSVYEQRFQSCRDFPHLHQPEVKRRLFAIFMSYGRCPIIFNVMEALKLELNFLPVT